MGLKEPIVIDNFQKGMAQSAILGFEKISNMDISSNPGMIKQGLMLDQASVTAVTYTIESIDTTANTITATISYPSNINLQPVVFTGASLPTGITAGTVYFAKYVSPLLIYLYDTWANADDGGATGRVDITVSGSGTFINLCPQEITKFFNGNGNGYGVDSNKIIWELSFGNPKLINGNDTSGQVKGVAFYKNYLLSFYGTSVEACSPSVLSWNDLTLGTGTFGQATFSNFYSILGVDDTIYFTNGNCIGSLVEVAGQTFDPTNNATYSLNANVLDLPLAETSTCLAEYGGNLIIGTTSGNIYTWNKIDSSFGLPFTVGEDNVWRIVNRNSNLYIFAGNSGSIYQTNTVSSTKIGKIPDKFTGYSGLTGSETSIKVRDAINLTDEIIFSVEHPFLDYLSEIWSLDNNNSLTLKNTYSKTQSSTTKLYGGGLFKYSGKVFYASWYYTNTGGIDTNNFSGYRYAAITDNYKPYFISPYYEIGKYQQKTTLENVEVRLTEKTTSGINIKVEYRENLNDSWSTVGTGTYVSPGYKSLFFPFSMPLEAIQIKVTYYGGNGQSIKSIIIR